MASIKTRDIRLIIQQKGLERGVQEILEAQNDMIKDQNRNLLMLAQMFDKMQTVVQQVVNIAGDVKSAVDEVNKKAQHTELGVSTQSLGEGDD